MASIRPRTAFVGCLAMAGLLAVPLASADEPGRSADAAIASFVNDQTIAVVAMDLASPGTASTIIGLLRAVPYREPDQAEVPDGMRKALSYLVPGSDHGPSETDLRPRAGIGRVYLVAIWSDPIGFFSDPQRERKTGLEDSLFLVVPEATKEVVAGMRELLPEPKKMAGPLFGPAAKSIPAPVIADSRLLDRLAALKATPRPEIAEALLAAGQRPVRIAVAPPALFSRAASEILTTPVPGTTEPLGQYLAQIRWIGVSSDATGGLLQLRLLMKLVPGADNERMLEFLGRITPRSTSCLFRRRSRLLRSKRLRSNCPLPGSKTITSSGRSTDRLPRSLRRWPDNWPRRKSLPKRWKSTASISRPSVSRSIATTTSRSTSQTSPFAIPRASPLSWRVAILPYLEQGKLYERFHLDEPWDSQHNRKLIDEIPAEFRTARTPQGRTRFLAPVGKNLAFTPEASELNVKSFSDGTVNTIRVVGVDPDHSVVWTKPEDLVVDLENPRLGITDGRTSFIAGFADASVHHFKGLIRPKALRAFFTRNGREPQNFDNLYAAP